MRPVLSFAAVLLVLISMVPMATHGQQRPQTRRLNALVSLLDKDKAAFGVVVSPTTDPVPVSANDNIDFVFMDMEHQPFDMTELRKWMQWLLDPGAIAKAGDVKAAKSVIVRIPAYGRELASNTWQVKQVLDSGVHGIIFPTIESPEHAFTAISAMRYPQKSGASDVEPEGIRGTAPNIAARYWGLPVPEYIERADIWRLDAPNGNLIPWMLIESRRGVENVREIARQLKAKNIGAVLYAGGAKGTTGGDMGVSYGGDVQAINKAIDTILAAGKEFGLPVAVALGRGENIKEQIQQGARIFIGAPTSAMRKEAGR